MEQIAKVQIQLKKAQIESNFQSAAYTHIVIYLSLSLYVCVCAYNRIHMRIAEQ